VRLRSFFADVLAYLEFAQAIDYQRADDQSGEQGCEACEGRAEGQITEDSERREVVKQL